jgi:hypothetical protein
MANYSHSPVYGNPVVKGSQGITLFEHFAALALNGILASGTVSSPDVAATRAVQSAEALYRALVEHREQNKKPSGDLPATGDPSETVLGDLANKEF